MSMTGEILQRIYDSEINFSLGWMWDNGVEYAITDLYYAEEAVEATGERNIDEAMRIIADRVAAEYPKSAFAKWWQEVK